MNYHLLSKTSLFKGLSEKEVEAVLPCLDAREQQYKKGDVLFRVGDSLDVVGLVEAGRVNVVVDHHWGNSSIFASIEQGSVFGANNAAIPQQPLPGNVVAAEDTEVLYLHMRKLLTTCDRCCPFHQRMIENLFGIMASKGLSMAMRMMHTAPKTIRERVLSYLSEQSAQAGSTHFRIPFSRQQLADYLGVERSALSNELGKMRRDGLIEFRKNEFTLKP